MDKRIALLTDKNFVLLRSDNTFQLIPHDITTYTNVEKILEQATKYNVFNLWVAPFTDLSGIFTLSFLEGTNEYGVKRNTITNENYVGYCEAYRKTNGFNETICITIPEYVSLWKFGEYEDISPNDLLVMLVVLRDKLGIAPYKSPTKIGIDLLEELTPNEQKFWLQACEFDFSDIPTAINLIWRNEGVIAPKKYLHVVDKNGAFLSSYQSTLLGSGTPKHMGSIPFDSTQVGIWKVTFHGTSQYNGKELPLPYNPYYEWYFTPEVKITEMLGYQVEVHDSWLWENNHKNKRLNQCHYIFRKWAKLLWDSRQEIKELYEKTGKFGYLLAYDSIKKIYTETGGRLAIRANDFKTKDVYKRVDWFSMIVADTRLKVLYQVDKLLKQGYSPIMVETDALYYLSDEQDIRLAIPGILDHSTSLGGYKLKYSFEWSTVSELFNSGLSPNNIATELNRLDRQGMSLKQGA